MHRLLQFAESSGVAGGENYLRLLAQSLSKADYSLMALLPESGLLKERLQQCGVSSGLLRLDPLGSPGPLLRLVRFLRSNRIHLIQSHGARTNFYARLAGRFAGTPVIISTVHNLLWDYPVSPLRRAVYVALDRLTAPLCHRVLCVAESHRQAILERYRLSPEKVIAIPNAVDLSEFQPRHCDRAFRDAIGIPTTAPVIGIIGRLTPQKGHTYLLSAFQCLLPQFPSLQCFIVGGGELLAELQAQAAKLGISGRCHFLGSRTDIRDILASIDILAIPSLSEGLPYIALEGMAMAKPIVASAVNGLLELIEDGVTGRLVPRGDVQALADTMRDLLLNPVTTGMLGHAARAKVERDHSIDQWIRQMESLYEELLSSRR